MEMIPPGARAYSSLPDRFWAKVDKNGPTPAHRPELGPCWLWTGATTNEGYGKFWWEGSLRLAHRVAHEDAYGLIAPGLLRDHLCRMPLCVRPDHGEAVTARVNLLRGVGLAAVEATRTHCPAGHPYDAANTYIDAKGIRHCRACHRDRERERSRRLRAVNPEALNQRSRAWKAIDRQWRTCEC